MNIRVPCTCGSTAKVKCVVVSQRQYVSARYIYGTSGQSEVRRTRVLAFHLRVWDEAITYPTTTSLDVPDQKREGEKWVSNCTFIAHLGNATSHCYSNIFSSRNGVMELNLFQAHSFTEDMAFIYQCFSPSVRPRPGTFFFHKTRARSQQIYS